MEAMQQASQQRFRVWIAAYRDWAPTQWNEAPPLATAVEPVDDALFSAEEAALFLEGFNSTVLDCEQPIWAVAVPITVRYEGDAQAGRPVKGHVFPLVPRDSAAAARSESTAVLPAQCLSGGPGGADAGGHFQGFDQSPQRSR